ncbi:sulfurtransferase [Endozoicomonas ascidiicola]|uniref:sulfurtransferase n=1 Tax=Endozoicomonas ascidiicola TaxID=1698521 RepID=UPI00082AE8D0|nr:sulfurtransferase [Endozoicomonas ascidiicola]
MTLLIEPEMLATLLNDEQLVVLDARFSLADIKLGRVMYDQGHIPGAIYADLEKDLSGDIIPGKTGRHPLPESSDWLETLSRWGITESSQIVVYDDGGHAMAARAWWLLRWAGLRHVSVLHGGMKAWLGGRYPVTADTSETIPVLNHLTTGHMPVISADDLQAQIVSGGLLNPLVDARAHERFRGEEESIDPIAGHIPGATCHPFTDNLNDDGRFLPPEQLNEIFSSLTTGSASLVFYCGSGVTACHNILAMEYAGLHGAVLYSGSWSEWITNPERPVARG